MASAFAAESPDFCYSETGSKRRTAQLGWSDGREECWPAGSSPRYSSGVHHDKRLRAAEQQSLSRCGSLDSDGTYLTVSSGPAGAGCPPIHAASQDSFTVASSESFVCASGQEIGQAHRRLLEELEEANECVASLPIPGGLDFVPVSTSCCMIQLAASYSIPAVAVCLGASYYQRLLMQSRPMQAAAAACGFFLYTGQRWEMQCVPGTSTAVSVYITCIYLAAKVTDRINFKGMLSHMLSNVLGRVVDSEQAVALERACLVQLDWRLGPFFNPDF